MVRAASSAGPAATLIGLRQDTISAEEEVVATEAKFLEELALMAEEETAWQLQRLEADLPSELIVNQNSMAEVRMSTRGDSVLTGHSLENNTATGVYAVRRRDINCCDYFYFSSLTYVHDTTASRCGD
jgi:hypothetical protein